MKITLPAKIEYKIELISNFYGSIYLASKYIGRSEKITLILRYWQHGWISKSRQHHPWVVASEPIDNKRALILVARKDEEVFLNKSGYKSKAIGLPYCYTPEKKYPRIEKSLLVMPAHGTHDVLIQVTDD